MSDRAAELKRAKRVRLSRNQSHTGGGFLVPASNPRVKTGEPSDFVHKPQPVVLDDEGAGKGMVFDLRTMSKANVKEAMTKTNDPVALLSMFRVPGELQAAQYHEYTAEELQDRGIEIDQGNDLAGFGGQYVAPRVNGDGAPLQPPPSRAVLKQQLPDVGVEQIEASGPASFSTVNSFAASAPAGAQAPAATSPQREVSRAAGVLSPPAPPAPPAPAPAAPPVLPLRVEFLDASTVLKPGRTVIFDFDKMGQLSSRYHEVLYQGRCLVLVYDSRYDEGSQYLPPAREEPLRVLVPHLGLDFSGVVSADFKFTMGVLDFVLLWVTEEPKQITQSDNV